jgi:hypothetical protein
MGFRLGIAGEENTGKSWGRRYIPDGENVMIIAPSIKTSHLFTGPKGVEKMSNDEINAAIKAGTRKPVKHFDIAHPAGKYASIAEAFKQQPDPHKRNLSFMLRVIQEKWTPEMLGDKPRKFLKGNVILCDDLNDLKLFINFINEWMPWIHTIILPDFTHFVSNEITSAEFLSRKAGGEQYAKYLDLAASTLRSFITSSDTVRHDLIIVTEYHATKLVEQETYKLFLPGGKMVEEKFLPASYYDDLFFADVKFPEDDGEAKGDYRFVTRKTDKYPQARSTQDYDDLYIPNDLNAILTNVRRYNGIELSGTIVE